MILVFGPCRHDGASFLCAVHSDGTIQHVDLVGEVHGVHSNPLVQILAIRQHHRGPEVSRAKCGIGVVTEEGLVIALGDVLLWLERLGGGRGKEETHGGGKQGRMDGSRFNEI